MNINLSKATLLFGFFLTSVSGFSKVYTGQVTDKKGNPVEFANVVLLSKSDSTFLSGCMTDKNGRFSILYDKPVTTLLLKISSVGYAPLYKDNVQENMGVLQISTDSKLLNGVTVEGSIPQTTLKDNALVTNIQGTVLEKIGTANDVLDHIPGLTKLDNTYTVLGKGEPLIYINGKKLRNKNELDRLKSEDIKNVELITNPGAEYDASTSAVVKIITNKKAGDGFGFNYRQVLNQGYKFNHNEMLDANYRKEGLDVFTTLRYGRYNVHQEQYNDYRMPDANQLQVKENTSIENNGAYFEGTAGFNYDFNDKHSVGATYTIDKTVKYFDNYWIDNIEVWKAGRQAEAFLNRSDFYYRKLPTHTFNTYYAGSFGKVKLEWDGDLYFTKDGRDQYTDEKSLNQNADSHELQSTSSSESRLYATKLTVSFPLWKGDLKVGSEYTNTQRKSDYSITGNADNLPGGADDKIKESNTAGFFSYGVSINKVQLNAGLRYEHVISDYYSKGKYIPEQSREYNNFFPSFSINFPVDKVQLSFSYSTRTVRPSYRVLGSEVQYNNRYVYQGGNPLLRPATIHDISGVLSWKWIQFTAGWQYKKDMFYSYIPDYENNPEITIYKYSNFPKTQQVRAELDLSPKFGFWEPQLSLIYLRQHFRITQSGYEHNYNSPMCFVTFNNAFHLPGGFLFRVDMEYYTEGSNNGLIQLKSNKYMDISLYKGFWNDRLTFNLQVNDLFASNYYKSHLIYGAKDFYTSNYHYTRNVQLTIRYKFNQSRSKYKGSGAGNAEKGRL